MESPNKSQRQPRIAARFETLYSAGREEGSGVLENISSSGALLRHTSMRPALESSVRLYVFLHPVDPFQIVGRVVRQTPEGFAVEFKNLDPKLQELVAETEAVVGAPDRERDG